MEMPERSPQWVTMVRHTDAGSRASFDGPDDERPLTTRGWAQATALAELLAGRDIAAIVSSPSRRCVETVMPLAERVGLEIECEDALCEDGSAASAVDALVRRSARTSGIVVGSTHGPIFDELLRSIGSQVERSGPHRIAKGGRTELTFADGEIVELAAYAPPEIDR
jgi:8-oxo-dGTP diphosphatase